MTGSKFNVSAKISDQRARIAVDLGAESCRVSLMRWSGNRPTVELVHRFPNAPVNRDGHLYWDIALIWSGVQDGLRRCAEIATEGISSLAVDGWAVDYVRIDGAGEALEDPYCYRDARTLPVEAAVHAGCRPEFLFGRTGIQPLRINTLYQLIADVQSGRDPATAWVCLPEYILMKLGGRRVAEYTNATHTGLIDPETREWAADLFTSLKLDIHAAPPIVPPGSCVGKVTGSLARLAAFEDTALIAPACHDTASAVSALPAISGDIAYISSGTWSLVGALTGTPCTLKEAFEGGFTNLGAIGGRFCLHKNVTGMWLLKQCMEHWRRRGVSWTVPDLIEAAAKLSDDVGIVPVDAPELMLPGDMPSMLNEQLKMCGQPGIPEDAEHAPHFAMLIFSSLAHRYAEVIRSLEKLRSQPIREIHIVGGGSRNHLLNQLTREATGKDVVCGQVESSTIGNFAIQLAAANGALHPRIGVSAEAVIAWSRDIILGSEMRPS